MQMEEGSQSQSQFSQSYSNAHSNTLSHFAHQRKEGKEEEKHDPKKAFSFSPTHNAQPEDEEIIHSKTPRDNVILKGNTYILNKKNCCNCKKSRCLKLYCDCFAKGEYCHGCNCINCHNIRQYEQERQVAIQSTLDRNPSAFNPKIGTECISKKETVILAAYIFNLLL
jgi:hypothetical protein